MRQISIVRKQIPIRSGKAAKPDLPMIVRNAHSGGLTRVNRTFTEQVGYNASELENSPLTEWIEPADRDRFQQILDERTGTLLARHRTKQGDWIEFDWKVSSEDKRPVVFGVLHENGDPKENLPEPQTAVVPTDMNEVLEAMALIIEDERPGMKCSVLLLDDAGLRVSVGAGPSLPDEYNSAVEGLKIGPTVGSCGTAAFWNERIIVEDIHTDVLWKDLKKHAVKAGVASCWSHPITSKSGKVLGATALYSPEPRAPTQHELDGLATAARMFGLAIERSYAEQALKTSETARIKRESELEDQLHQAAKMEALGVLAGGLAHDFNNMLVTVLGNAELAMMTIPQESETYEMLRNIITASRRSTELCGQMLAYTGRGVMSTKRLEWNRMIREMGRLLQVTLSKKATLEYKLCDEPLFVEADRAKIDQVIMNLITNASEALANDPGRILASTGTRYYNADELERFQRGAGLAAGDYNWFTVSDTGCGMNPETQKRVFDPFFTTKSTGRGLGLAAVRGIILRHNGAIGIKSEVSSGTTFTVLLPRASRPKKESKPETKSAQVRSSKCVLVVDDEMLVREALVRILRKAGFTVLQAGDGREAIEVFHKEQNSIDCVLLDLSMPELDGEETFRELRKIRHDLPVVLQSGYAEQDILNRVLGAGFAGVLQKPTQTDVLLAKLHEVSK